MTPYSFSRRDMLARSGVGLGMVGLAGMLEVPVVVVNVQRGGPSTGLPTKTEQADLFWATVGGMGLTGVIVAVRFQLAPVESAWCAVTYRRCRDCCLS